MHCLPEIVREWQSICESHNHFVAPMHASQYDVLFNQFISKNFSTDYRKGEVPFELTQKTMIQLFDNLRSEDFKFENDFGCFLMKLYETNSIVFRKVICYSSIILALHRLKQLNSAEATIFL